jgi:TrkA-N domain/RyR domain
MNGKPKGLRHSTSKSLGDFDQGGDPFRKRAVEMVRLFEQPLFGLFGLLALVFGFFGYRQYFAAQGIPADIIETLYADIQLIKLSSRVNTTDVPWMLNVGRLLAPAVSGYAAFRGLTALYRDRFDRFRIQTTRNHTIVIGANQQALAVTRTLCATGKRVIVVDRSLTVEQALSLRSIGALTVVGDGTRPEVLRQAGAHRARQVLAVSDDDSANIDSALRSRLISSKRMPRAVGTVTRPELCELLRIEAIGRTSNDGVRAGLDFFNDRELTARHIERSIREGHSDGALYIDAAPRETVQLLTRLARTRFDLPIYLGPATEPEVVRDVAQRINNIESTLTIVLTSDLANPEVDWATIRCAVVGGTDSETLTNAMAISRRLPAHAKVIAIVPDSRHLSSLLGLTGGDRAVPIELVDPLMWWRDSDLILGGTVEIIARATHDNYCATRSASTEATTDPATVAWEELPEQLKKSNRDQARHVWIKLDAVGCVLAPHAGDGEMFQFTADEVELLARLEHDRWVKERRSDGWTSGERNVERKTTPYLVGWNHLTEEVRDLDRAAVIGLPAFVNDVGYRIVRRARRTQGAL